MSDRDYTELYASLQKETTILTAQIRALYRELDKKFHLRGAQIPITFGFETDALGSYTRTGHHEKEHFHFSLLFVGYGVKNPLSKEDRMDLYKHEYAHYMEHHIVIPREYQWQPGLHGSAWKYCCSLVGAAPTPYYKAGEALMKHDYEKNSKIRFMIRQWRYGIPTEGSRNTKAVRQVSFSIRSGSRYSIPSLEKAV